MSTWIIAAIMFAVAATAVVALSISESRVLGTVLSVVFYIAAAASVTATVVALLRGLL